MNMKPSGNESGRAGLKNTSRSLIAVCGAILLAVAVICALSGAFGGAGVDPPIGQQPSFVPPSSGDEFVEPSRSEPLPEAPSVGVSRKDAAVLDAGGDSGVHAPQSLQEVIRWLRRNGVEISPGVLLDRPEAWEELQQIAEGTRRNVREARAKAMELGQELAKERISHGQFERFLSDGKVDSEDPKAQEKWPWMFRKGMAFRRVQNGFEDGKHVAKVVDIMPGESARIDEENARAESYLESMRLAVQDLLARRSVPPR